MSQDPHVGTRIGGYRIEAVVGRGGMGVVYRAEQVRLRRTVALKLIAPELAEDAGFRARFEREAVLAAALDHPHVLPVHEAGEHEGLLFIVARYVEGTDLGREIAEEGRIEPARAARIVAQIGEALDAAHERGLVHRDIKPANILLAGEGAEEHAYLTDFGLTKRTASAAGLTRTGEALGSVDYMAPEQIAGGRVDGRADVYALGAVLYRALTGELPYGRDSDAATMWAHMNDPPPVPTEAAPTLPRALDEVVARAMAKDREGRYPSAGDLGRAALAAAAGRAVSGPEREIAATAAVPTAALGEETRPAAAETVPLSQGAGATRRRLLLIPLALILVLVLAAAALAATGAFSGDDGGAEAVASPEEQWQSRTGPEWNAFSASFSQGFGAGCRELFSFSRNARLYKRDGEALRRSECLALEEDPDAAGVAVPALAPQDPARSGEELGRNAGCAALFDAEGEDKLFFGPASITPRPCQAATVERAPKVDDPSSRQKPEEPAAPNPEPPITVPDIPAGASGSLEEFCAANPEEPECAGAAP